MKSVQSENYVRQIDKTGEQGTNNNSQRHTEWVKIWNNAPKGPKHRTVPLPCHPLLFPLSPCTKQNQTQGCNCQGFSGTLSNKKSYNLDCGTLIQIMLGAMLNRHISNENSTHKSTHFWTLKYFLFHREKPLKIHPQPTSSQVQHIRWLCKTYLLVEHRKACSTLILALWSQFLILCSKSTTNEILGIWHLSLYEICI